MDPVMLSRLQFAAATASHFLFVPLTLIWAYRLFRGRVQAHELVY